MITPDQFDATPVYDLLRDASEGRIGLDQRFIRSIVSRPDQAIPALVKWGTEDHEDASIDIAEDIENMLLFLDTPDAIPFFIHQIRLSPVEVSDTVLEALYKQRDQAVEPLLKLYAELEEDLGGEVAFILATFRKYDERVLQILLDRLEYDAGDGAISLGVYGDPAAKPALEKLLAEIGESDAHLKSDITGAIAELGRPIENVFPNPFDIWGLYPEIGLPQFDLLSEPERLEMLKSESPKFRVEAITSFINRDYSDEARERLFEIAKSDSDEEVRGTAWEALTTVVEDHNEIGEAMFARLSDNSAPSVERAGALIGLASKLKNNRDLRSFAEEFYHNDVTRAKALEAMWKSFDRSFAEYMPQHLDDADEDVQRAAIWGVGYLGITAASEQLVRLFDDQDLRSDALFAYALSARHEISKARIHGLYRKIEEAAEGLTERESELVQLALDERLMLNGKEPVFFREEFATGTETDDTPKVDAVVPSVGRNDPCPCGSGQKYKKCHGA
jgi:HEAT repeat protein